MRSELNECALGVDLRGIHSAFYRTRHLERNAEVGISFHVFEENLLAAAVIEFGGPAVGVPCDALRYFERAVIFQKIGDTGGSKRVRRIVRW
jgi:hypothetical protein